MSGFTVAERAAASREMEPGVLGALLPRKRTKEEKGRCSFLILFTRYQSSREKVGYL